MRNRFTMAGAACALAGWATLAALGAAEPGPDPYAGETKEQRDARMAWWREARFGLFIHWGVYAVPAGVYKDRKINGAGEWIMYDGRIPVAEYRAFAKSFNPVKYDADAWVRLAKEAGMKYIVITSKHHDGFALFKSKASAWNVVDASPYGQDLLKPLAEACRKHGLRLGFYYSQAQDWNNPGGAAYGGHWDSAQDGSMDDYLRDVAVPQVKEILTNYGPLAILWWDTPCDMTKERADLLVPLLRLQPGIIHNNRLGIYPGDTETPEQHIPATGYGDRDWETCMTMNDTWGYKLHDHNWKSTETLVRNLIDIVSKGGNYLLNVGPTAEGLIPAPSIERLKAVGAWMKINGEAIYATSASPFKKLPWGRCTKKLSPGGATLYLHVFDWPAEGILLVPGLKNAVDAAYLLADPSRKTLRASAAPDGVVIETPPEAPDAISTTVVLEIRGAVEVEPLWLTQKADGAIALPACEATLHGSGLKYESGPERDNIGYWLDPREWASWDFMVTAPGVFKVSMQVAAVQKSALTIILGDREIKVPVPATGDYGRFTAVPVGTLGIGAAGKTTLAVKPVVEEWQPVNLKSIDFTPAK